MFAFRDLVAELLIATRLPVVSNYREYALAGAALIAYSADVSDRFRRAGDYVDRILRGADPGELPIQLPAKFYFIVNLKTADTLGIALPTEIMIQATEFIE